MSKTAYHCPGCGEEVIVTDGDEVPDWLWGAHETNSFRRLHKSSECRKRSVYG